MKFLRKVVARFGRVFDAPSKSIPVGFWYTPEPINKHNPKVEDAIDPEWIFIGRRIVIDYLSQDHPFEAEYGCHTCLICGREAGSKTYTDDGFTWPESLLHYVFEHHVKPPGAFIQKIATIHIARQKDKNYDPCQGDCHYRTRRP